EYAPSLDDARAYRAGSAQRRVDWCHRLVDLLDGTVREQLVVRAAYAGPGGEQEYAGGHPIEAVRWRQLRQLEVAAQAYERRLQHMPAAGHRRQEVGFVD